MLSLDNVMQAPGGPKEDPSGGFKYGGWVAPFSDETYSAVVKDELKPAEYLLGRKTFDIWADYWPTHGEFWPGINSGNKYIFSGTLKKSDPRVKGWNNTIVIRRLADIKNLKQSAGPDLHVWGSHELVQLLLKNDLVDELRLKIHPVILGKGKKLFSNNAFPRSFKLLDSIVTSTGVIIAHYRKDAEVRTGESGA